MSNTIQYIKTASAIAIANLNASNNESITAAAKALIYCYIFEEKKLSTKLCQELIKIDTPRDFDKWEFIKNGLVILSLEMKNNEALKSNVQAMIDSSKFPVSIQKVFTRRINGAGIDYEKIDQAISEGYTDIEIMRRVSQISELLFIAAMGGSEEFPASKALDLIQEHSQKIKDSIDTVDLTQIYPFDELLSAQ